MDFMFSVITIYHECLSLFFFLCFIFCVWIFANVYVCVPCVRRVHGGQKRVWDLLPGTGVTDGCDHHMGTGNQV